MPTRAGRGSRCRQRRGGRTNNSPRLAPSAPTSRDFACPAIQRSLSLTRGPCPYDAAVTGFVRMHMMRKETFQALVRMMVTQQRPSRPHALTPSRPHALTPSRPHALGVTSELSHNRTNRSTRSRLGDAVRTTRRRHCRPIRSVAARLPAWRPDACPDARPAVRVCTRGRRCAGNS